MNVFLVWTNFQARVEGISKDLSKEFGKVKIIYNNNPRVKYKFLKVMYYFVYIIRDFNCLIKYKPKVIFVQIPPQYSLIAPLLYKKIFNKKVIVVADLHNSALRAPWINRLMSKYLVKRSDLKLVHNEVVYKKTPVELLKQSNELIILEDKTEFNDSKWNDLEKRSNLKNEKVSIFFPASFNMDEPIIEVLKAAKKMKNHKFVLTGNLEKLKDNFGVKSSDLPENVQVTGWLTKEEYQWQMDKCDILLGLTIFDDIQMSVSNEGLANNKLMVLSDTPTLKYLYGSGAIYVKNEAASICKGIITAKKNNDMINKELMEAKNKKMKRYKMQLNNLVDSISDKS